MAQIVRPPDAAREMDQEIAAHLELAVEDLVRQGFSPEEARRKAEERFGNLPEARRLLRDGARRRNTALHRRDWTAGLRHDLAFTFRQARRAPGYWMLAVATLGIGLGMATAVFTLVERVLLRPLVFPDSERLVQLTGRDSLRNAVMTVSMGNWIDWRDQARTLAGTALVGPPRRVALLSADSAGRVGMAEVTDSYFGVLGGSFTVGRGFTAEEAGQELPVAVVSHRLWRQALGADPTLAQPLRLGSGSYTVVGVVAPGFEYPGDVDVWLPTRLRPDAGAMRNNINWTALARLKPGVTPAAAVADLSRIADGIRAREPEGVYSWGVGVESLQSRVVGEARESLWLLLGAVSCVLLIVCANLATTTLGRAAARRQELAVRAALGAGRGRLARQLLLEHLVLAMAGAVVGLGLAWAAVRVVATRYAGQIPRAGELRLDLAVFGFAAGAALLVGLLAGLLPAVQGSRLALRDVMAQGGRAVVGTKSAGGSVLVAVEFALAVLLLSGAGLLIRSFQHLLARDLGFDSGAAAVEIVLQGPRYARDSLARSAYWDRLLAAYRAIPSVEAVGLANWVPLGTGGGTFLALDDVDDPRAGAGYRIVGDDYFRALGVGVAMGRSFTPADRGGAEPVAMINRALAEKYWPGRNPLGKRIRAVSMEMGARAPWRTVVGVVNDLRHWGPETDAQAEMYVPFGQGPGWAGYAMTAVVRSSLPPRDLLATLRRSLRDLDPGVPGDFSVLDDRLDDRLAPRRLTMSLLGGFAAVALLLAALGIYGVLSYAVARRTGELAIRAALGAEQSRIFGLVLRSGLRPVALGAAAGLLGAFWLSRVLETMLVDVDRGDPLTYLFALGILGLVAIAATLVPAVRAARSDPMRTLRSE